jgi:hypothetical protein
MNAMYWQEHEMGTKPRIRIWTKQDEAYGSFKVMEYDDFQTLKTLCEKYNWSLTEMDN